MKNSVLDMGHSETHKPKIVNESLLFGRRLVFKILEQLHYISEVSNIIYIQYFQF